MRKVIPFVLLIAFAFVAAPLAQHMRQPVAALAGKPALELMLRKLDTVGTLMMTTAHPDDENNAMLAYYGHVRGMRTTLVTATRGEGGQNEIGPELFEALAVLRTEELLAAHRFDGAEQFFTRAVDFGYSFSVEETYEKWGHQEILGDFVRMIRLIRPDVIVGFVFDGEGGGQHHQASSRLTLEAFRAAADPARFPEQIAREGLRPWQASKFYYTAGFGFGPGGGDRALPGEGARRPLLFRGGDVFDPVLGRTCAVIGGEARSMHKCQGMSQLLPLPQGDGPGFGGPRAYRLRDTVLPDGVDRDESDLFDGVETGIRALASFAGPEPPPALTSALDEVARHVDEARRAVAVEGSAAAIPPLASGHRVLRELRDGFGRLGLSDEARFEIGFRLAQKQAQFAEALRLAADLRIEAVAADGLVVGGQNVPVQVIVANHGGADVTAGALLNGFAGVDGACTAAALAAGSARTCRATATIPADARLTGAHFRYAEDAARFVLDEDVPPGLPFRPTPFTATVTLTIGGETFPVTLPVQHRTEGNIFSGEKRAELHVVPKFAVTAGPEIVIVPVRSASAAEGRYGETSPKLASAPDASEGGRGPAWSAEVRPGPGPERSEAEIRVTVINHSPGAAEAEVRLDLPAGWTATPAAMPVRFAGEDEAMTVRFVLAPPAALAPGRVEVKARVVEAGRTYARGYQVVEYPHIQRRHVPREPVVTLNAIDLQVALGLTVGYVTGVGDQVPQALEQIGARVSFIGSDELAWGDLDRYDVIMTGVRAYERRADLRAYNHRLIDYARRGGTVIVHYNRFEFNQGPYGPYPGKVGRERVTDEDAPVRLLVPDHPVFTTPNRITGDDWRGWRQERGLYFFDTATADPRYVDLLEFEEPFPFNQGWKRGALVEAKVGEGRWIYLGIGLWRQLPAGTDGAYRLMANLISLGRQAP